MIIFKCKDMKKLSHKLLLILSAILSIASTIANVSIAHADENQLHIKPTRCIALHEGQVCYQTLNISWKAEIADTYCLYQQDNKTPLVCWDNLASGKWSYEFEGATTQKFMLLRKQDAKQIAEVSIEVAWVYDASSKRESHWRIF